MSRYVALVDGHAGAYGVVVPDLPGCVAVGENRAEVKQLIREAIELCLEVEGEPEQSLEFIGIQRITIAA